MSIYKAKNKNDKITVFTDTSILMCKNLKEKLKVEKAA